MLEDAFGHPLAKAVLGSMPLRNFPVEKRHLNSGAFESASDRPTARGETSSSAAKAFGSDKKKAPQS
jgi:hypothetical protein